MTNNEGSGEELSEKQKPGNCSLKDYAAVRFKFEQELTIGCIFNVILS